MKKKLAIVFSAVLLLAVGLFAIGSQQGTKDEPVFKFLAEDDDDYVFSGSDDEYVFLLGFDE